MLQSSNLVRIAKDFPKQFIEGFTMGMMVYRIMYHIYTIYGHILAEWSWPNPVNFIEGVCTLIDEKMALWGGLLDRFALSECFLCI